MAAASALADYMESNHGVPKRSASNLKQAKITKKPRGGPKGGTQLKKLLSSLAKEQLVEVLLKLDEDMPSVGIAAKVEAILPSPDLEAIQVCTKTCPLSPSCLTWFRKMRVLLVDKRIDPAATRSV